MDEIDYKKLTDDDGHWYWIPTDLVAEFNEHLGRISGIDYMSAPDDFDEFSEKYEKYRTMGDPENTPDFFKE